MNSFDTFKDAMRIAFNEGAKKGETFEEWWKRIDDKAMRGQLLSLSVEAPIFAVQNILAEAEIE
jgi:hypothetical protein